MRALAFLTVASALLFAIPIAAAADNQRAVVDWSRWDAILRAHVVDGRVDYDAIGSDPGFTSTVEAIASADLAGHDAPSVLAFYINSYNVLAVQGILAGRSPKSAFGKLRFFKTDTYSIAGEKLSLYALEHQRIRPLGEPRIHFAIVCASMSCPPLRSEAYLPPILDEQLGDNARRFINDPEKNRFELDQGIARLSKIFKWFDEDFEASAASVQAYVADFIDDRQAAEALRVGRLAIKYLPYDWSLNGTFEQSAR